MNKTVILVGCRDTDGVFSIMHDVSNELEARHVTVLNRYYTVGCGRHVMTTANCCIYFVRPSSILDAMAKADAVFGEESFKPILWMYCKPDADLEPTMDLVTYICHIEHICECAMYNPAISVKELVEGVRVMGRIGKKRLVEKFADDCESESKRHLELGTAFADGFEAGATKMKPPIEKIREVFERAKANGVIADNKWEIKLRDIDEWSKTPPYLSQQQLYLSLGRCNGKTALQNAFLEYYDYLKRADTPISKQLEECAEYCRKDVEMTSFLYKQFNMPNDKPTLPEIKNVIFNDPATIVMWADGTKTVVQCQDGDIYDPEKGLAMAISKKIMGNKRDYYHTFKHWLKKYKEPEKVQEFEFTINPEDLKFDPPAGLDLCRGKFTFHFDNKKEDE